MSEGMPDLGQHIGPLPLGGWLLAIGGGLVGAIYLRNRAATSPAADASTAASDPNYLDNGTGAAYSDPANPANLPDPITTGGPSGLPVTGRISDNNDWRRQAVQLLIGVGHSAIAAERAVAKYLAGQRLTRREAVMVNAAVTGLGTTPAPVPIPSVVHKKPKPTPAPPAHPHAHHHDHAGNGPRPKHPHARATHDGPSLTDTGRHL